MTTLFESCDLYNSQLQVLNAQNYTNCKFFMLLVTDFFVWFCYSFLEFEKKR